MRKKVLGVALPLTLLIASLAAGPARADHGLVNVLGSVNRGGTTVTGTFVAQDFCGGTFCSSSLGLPNREYGRFVRWCGVPLAVTIPANTSNTSAFCFGGGQWVFALGIGLRSADGSESRTHPDPITLHISPFKQ
jgi:hypothetical protein